MSVNAFFIHPKYGLSVRKAPFADKPYSLDWSAWGSAVVTSTWSADPGLTLGASDNTGTITSVNISGGTDQNRYLVTNNVVFASGLKESCSFFVIVDKNP